MSTPASESPIRTEPSWSELDAIAPLRLANAADGVDGVLPARVVAPETTEQVSAAMAWVNRHGLRVVARGAGSKLGWSNLPGNIDLVLSLEKFQKIVDHAWQDMTVTVQAGVTIAGLQTELAKQKQCLAIDPLWPERSTVGGVIATNDSGALRLRFGSMRDLILGVTVVLADGTIARSGGRVVKNVAGYDLPKLFTGSFGTLGILTEVTLRAHPLAQTVETLSIAFDDIVAAAGFMLAIADTTLVPTGMQLRIATNESALADLRFEGLEEGVRVQVQRAAQLATTGRRIHATEDVWKQRESLWHGDDSGVVAKFSVLPSALSDCVSAIRYHSSNYQVIAQSVGVGLVRAQLEDAKSLIALRSAIGQLGGTMAVVRPPLEWKKFIDVFGETNSAYPLMVRVKQRFDPKGILSPGRFLGGI
jgi:glycolate oxidase FAD binding subunit